MRWWSGTPETTDWTLGVSKRAAVFVSSGFADWTCEVVVGPPAPTSPRSPEAGGPWAAFAAGSASQLPLAYRLAPRLSAPFRPRGPSVKLHSKKLP
jgi:hypothetical protein